MNVIFLDIDGVLVTYRHMVQSTKYFGYEFDPVCVKHLQEVLHATGASIVVTSSWREGRTLKQLQSIFQINGISGIVGMTPVIEHAIRGNEIRQYMQSTQGTELEVKQFVIVDDEEEMGSLKDHLIETDFRDGLNEIVKEAIIQRLKS